MSPVCRIVVLGRPATGKTSILRRFLFGEIPTTSYDPTVEDVYRIDYLLNKERIRLHAVDTSGWELIPGMRRPYLSNCHGFVVVYSVKSRETFLEAWRICEDLGPVPKILVGTKAEVDLSYREVAAAEGRRAAEKMGCSFAETSSLSGVNVRPIFEEVLEQVEEGRKGRNRRCCVM